MKARDRSYYIRRAEAELALAQSAAHPAAMRAHYHLAGYYLDKVYSRIEAAATTLNGIASAPGEASCAA
ncbi:MAG: hypothetical protein ABW128_23655 [Rhizorhabdus sp.]